MQSIREMRQRHSARNRIPEIKKRLTAEVRRVLEHASAEYAAGLTADEFSEVGRQAVEEVIAIDSKLAKRDRRIVEALAELIPLLQEMRTAARTGRSEDRVAKPRALMPALRRWGERYEATDDAEQILTWLVAGDREPHQKGPKKRAAGIAYKVTARLPWTGGIEPVTVERIYRAVRPPPRREGWWQKPPKLSEPPGSTRSRRPISIPGARPKRRWR